MAFLDILRGRKREERKPERLPRGAFSPKANRPLAEKRPSYVKTEKPAKKQEKTELRQSALAAKFLLRPHITEQSTLLANKGIYTFRVGQAANKVIVKKAIKEMYGFEPIKIRVSNAPAKKRRVRGKTGVKSGFKKALVYLKEDDKIEFI